VVLRGAELDRVRAIDEHEEACLLALEEFLDDDLVAGRAEGPLDHDVVDRRIGFVLGAAQDDALAGGESVGLDDDRRPVDADEFLGGDRLVEAPEDAGRDVVFLAQVLHETLGAFEARRGGRRPERLDPAYLKAVDDAGDQRAFRPDDDEVDFFPDREGDDRFDVLGRDGNALGDRSDSRVPRCAVELRAARRAGDRPAQGMLAPSPADHEDLHGTDLPLVFDLKQTP